MRRGPAPGRCRGGRCTRAPGRATGNRRAAGTTCRAASHAAVRRLALSWRGTYGAPRLQAHHRGWHPHSQHSPQQAGLALFRNELYIDIRSSALGRRGPIIHDFRGAPMWKSAAAMLAGTLAVLASQELPALPLLLALSAPLLVAAVWRRWLWLLFLPVGALWCWVDAGQHLASRLDPAYEVRPIEISGWVSSLPISKGDLTEFQFAVEELDGRTPGPGIPALVRLSFQGDKDIPQASEHWRFGVKLRRPRGFMDPGSFDYEGWLFFHGIGATGYVARDAERLEGTRFPLLRLRSALRERMATALTADTYAGMATALAAGDQGGINEDQWRVLQATSTVHLMAIAGLHLGVVAGMLFLLARFLWRRNAWLCLRCPATVAGAVASLSG